MPPAGRAGGPAPDCCSTVCDQCCILLPKFQTGFNRERILAFIFWTGAVAAAVLGASLPPDQGPAQPVLMPPETARKAFLGCGLPARRIKVAWDQDFQEDIVTVASAPSSVPDAVLTCFAHVSVRTSYDVYFQNEVEQERYSAIHSAIADAANVANARAWLRQRHLLATMPLPGQDQPLATYARAVETFCGVKPGSLLVARSENLMTFADGGLGTMTEHGFVGGAATDEQFECVTNVTTAADLQSRKIFFGFIGNAAKTVP